MYLERRVEELEKQVKELKALFKMDNVSSEKVECDNVHGIKHLDFGTDAELVTNNKLRKELIQEAKDFVKEMTNRITDEKGYDDITDLGYIKEEVYVYVHEEPKFKVDYKNRKISVTLKSLNGMYKGSETAKCLDCDVFNVHIGKAIALGKALGLDVSKFTDVVQPDEVEVGHVVLLDMYKPSQHRVISKGSDSKFFNLERLDNKSKAWSHVSRMVILDDTNAKY